MALPHMDARRAVDILGLECWRAELIKLKLELRAFRFHLSRDERAKLAAVIFATENVGAFTREQSRRRDAIHHAARQKRERALRHLANLAAA